MRARPQILGCTALCVVLIAGCGGKHAAPRGNTNAAHAPGLQAPPRPTVLVDTEPRPGPRLTLGPSVLAPPRPAPQQVGKLRVAAAPCQVEGAVFLSTLRRPALQAVEVMGDKLYVLDHRGAIVRLDVLPGPKCRLRLDKTFSTAGVYRWKHPLERLSRGGASTLVASSFLGSVVIRAGRIAYVCNARDQGHVTLHPSGKWGLASYAGSDVQRLTFGPRACQGAPWHLTHLKEDARRRGPFRLVSATGFFGDLVLASGSLAVRVSGWHPHVIVALDAQGRRRFQIGALTGTGPQRFQWVRAIHPCGPRRVCVLDTNAGRLTLWGPTGKFQGAVSLTPLLGHTRGVVSDFAVGPRGALYVTSGRKPSRMAGKRNVGLDEGILFRVTGLGGATP